MRVTKIIKDYITNEVNKKFKEAEKNLPSDYKYRIKECEDKLYELKKEFQDKAYEIVKEYNLSANKEYLVSISTYGITNEEESKEYNKMLRELRQKRDDAIATIILNLELGETNKKELIEILEKVSF